MRTITIKIPDVIWQSHGQDTDAVREEVKRGLVIWEYMNGNLTIGESGEILKIGYRGFLELLWSKGISADALANHELDNQLRQPRNVVDIG